MAGLPERFFVVDQTDIDVKATQCPPDVATKWFRRQRISLGRDVVGSRAGI
jgi:hypothetical protein